MSDTLPTRNDAVVTRRRKAVLIIAASDTVRRSISRILARVPFDVSVAASLAEGLAVAGADPPDLVVVECGADTTPSNASALGAAAGAPVMLVGSDANTGLRCLESGAVADYVQSPIWERELRARAVRHAGGEADSGVLEFGDLLIDLRARAAWLGGAAVELTRREFDLLAFLTARPGRPYTREELLEHVWESSPDWQRSETIGEHIYRLRQKLESDPSAPRWIVTVPRAGYCFHHPGDASRPLSLGAGHDD